MIGILDRAGYFADYLVRSPESFDLLRVTQGDVFSRATLVRELVAETNRIDDASHLVRVLADYRRRETLRIAVGEMLHGNSPDQTSQQLTFVADAILQSVLEFVQRQWVHRHGTPRGPDGAPIGLCVLALGDYAGEEIDFECRLQLMVLTDLAGNSDGADPLSADEYFESMAQEICQLMAGEPGRNSAGDAVDEQSDGPAKDHEAIGYIIDLSLRPGGKTGPIASTRVAAMRYFQSQGRTWQRQAMLRLRAAAGDLSLADRFMDEFSSWVYPRFLSSSDWAGLRSLRRRIAGAGASRGGIADIQLTVQFLQLICGRESPAARSANTTEAMNALAAQGLLSMREHNTLSANYRSLRHLRHQMQGLFGPAQSHVPDDQQS
ncbi:MAG: hypothetical protein AAFP69_23730, partial [Planctomycetota bacterium]